MMKRGMIILALALMSIPMFAQNIGDRTLSNLNPVAEVVAKPAWDYGISAYLYSPYFTLTQTGLAYDGRNEKTPYLPQNGDVLNQGRFFANSLYRLDSLSAVKGAVSYERGVKKNVVWNETSDFELLYPYVAADSVGGNLQKEQYYFTGSYAKNFGKFTIAASLEYRALHEWRDVDPRPRNVTSDFLGGVSGGYDMGKYVASVSLLYHKYHQSQDIEFLKTSGANATILHLTGLGSDFARFAGSTSFNDTKYIGHGFTASALFQSKNIHGINAGLSYDLLKTKALLSNQNDAPMSDLLTQKLKGFASYSMTLGEFELGANLSGGYELRQGTEYVIDNASTGVFKDLMQMTMYRRHVYEVRGDFVAKWADFYVLPSLYFDASDARHIYPERKLDWSEAGGEVYAGWQKVLAGDWLVDLRAGGGYIANVSSEFEIPTKYTDSGIYNAYTSMASKFFESRGVLGAKVMAQKTLGSFGAVFVEPSVKALLFKESGATIYTTVKLGLTF